MPNDLREVPHVTNSIGYFREMIEDGKAKYVLFDSEGVPICVSPFRSVPFFFAVERDVAVLLRH